jgi:molybdenum cofactor cytidylyltransferase
MKRKILPPDDDYLIRCPRLGHQIYFSYCRSENMGSPCFKILDCWFNHFPVEEYLRQDLDPEEWNRLFENPPRSKVLSLMELIEQAKEARKRKAAGVILAAGSSTRMGEPKQLLKIGDIGLLDHVLGEALKSKLDLIVLVLGHRAGEIRKGLTTDLNNRRLKIVENSEWSDGISSSIIAGLSEVEDSFDHCMVILADMPYITTGLIDHLLHQYLSSGLALGAIKKGDRRSLPAIFGRSLYNELHQLRGDVGARNLFLKYPNRICLVEPEGEYRDMDIDTPEDYAAFVRSLDNT